MAYKKYKRALPLLSLIPVIVAMTPSVATFFLATSIMTPCLAALGIVYGMYRIYDTLKKIYTGKNGKMYYAASYNHDFAVRTAADMPILLGLLFTSINIWPVLGALCIKYVVIQLVEALCEQDFYSREMKAFILDTALVAMAAYVSYEVAMESAISPVTTLLASTLGVTSVLPITIGFFIATIALPVLIRTAYERYFKSEEQNSLSENLMLMSDSLSPLSIIEVL